MVMIMIKLITIECRLVMKIGCAIESCIRLIRLFSIGLERFLEPLPLDSLEICEEIRWFIQSEIHIILTL
jgi:hypothetical protein